VERCEKSVKRYVVRLSAEEREQLESLLRKGRSPAQRLLKARILLKADISEAGDGWSDSKIIAALETSASMVYRVRKQLVEEGLEAVLSRKQRTTPAVPPIFDGEKEAKLIALACSKPPKGRARWTLRLLENKVVELNIVDRASDSTIGRVLKKTLSSPIAANNGSSRPRPTARSSPPWRTCWPSTRGRATLIDRWSAWTRAQSNSSPRRECRSR
jgi:transposase